MVLKVSQKWQTNYFLLSLLVPGAASPVCSFGCPTAEMKGSSFNTVLFRSTFLTFILIAVSFPNLMPQTFRQTGGSSFKTCTLGTFSGQSMIAWSTLSAILMMMKNVNTEARGALMILERGVGCTLKKVNLAHKGTQWSTRLQSQCCVTQPSSWLSQRLLQKWNHHERFLREFQV